MLNPKENSTRARLMLEIVVIRQSGCVLIILRNTMRKESFSG